MLAAALVRRVGQAGGNAAILARGDATAGAMLIVCRDRGVLTALLERALQANGYAWGRVGPSLDDQANHDFDHSIESRVAAWIERRRSRDPDLWAVEVDIADAERFVIGLSDDL